MTTKLTLKEFIDTFPSIQVKAFAKRIDMTYSTFNALCNDKLYVTPQRKQEHIERIEKEINKLGEELRKIKLIIE